MRRRMVDPMVVMFIICVLVVVFDVVCHCFWVKVLQRLLWGGRQAEAGKNSNVKTHREGVKIGLKRPCTSSERDAGAGEVVIPKFWRETQTWQGNSLAIARYICTKTCYICNGQIDKMDYNLVQGSLGHCIHHSFWQDVTFCF